MKPARLLAALLGLFLLSFSAFGQKSLLQSGPMLGYSEMMEVMLWAQTKSEAKVQIAYWPKGNTAQKSLTDVVLTQKKDAFTAHLVADKVVPSTVYEYELRINDKAVPLDYPTTFQTQTLWQYRTDPPPFKVALGSCAYVNEEPYDRPGKPYGSEYQIFTNIHKQRPDLMLWLGDNTYLREADWYSRTGFQHRYTHTRSLPEMQPLLASTHHFAIWDDHDYGPNDSDRSWVHKETSKEVFQQFWANPTYGLPNEGGITTAFKWSDVDFFLIDNRYFRTPNNMKNGKRILLGKDQLEWLVEALISSAAPFKVVAIGGQTLTTYDNYETYIHLAPEERAYLLRRIEEENIKNVVFLSGDRHHTELSKMVNANGNTVYDLTVSPLTSGVHSSDDEVNLLRVEGTLVAKQNFGILEFSGPRKERKMTMKIFDAEGGEVWSREVAAEQ